MITVRRLLDGWKRAVTADSLETLAAPFDAALVDRVCVAAIVDPERVRVSLGSQAPSIPTTELAGLELAHLLACVGAPIDLRVFAPDLPATPRGALAALAIKGPLEAAALLPGEATTTPRVDDVAGTMRYLIAAVRDRDRNRAFAAWHATVAASAAGLADPATLVWIARIVVHDLGGQPIETVARWIHDTIERAAASQERSLADDREKSRVELLDDPVRIAARPEVRLRAWEHAARRISELLDCPLEDLGRELSRSVLVDPRQSPEAAHAIVARLAKATPGDPHSARSIADAANALACVGVALPDPSPVPGTIAADARLLARIHAALVALARGELDRAAAIVGERRGPFVGGLAFTNDMLSVLGYAVAAVRGHAVAATLDRALQRIGEQLDALCASGQLDEATVLWLARLVVVGLDRRPLGDVARDAHDWLWKIPLELEAARDGAATRTRTFPLGTTLGGGAYRIERWLQGTGAQRLYAGIEVATGGALLVAFDDHSPNRQNVDELRAAVAYRVPGVFELAHVGPLDDDREHWAVVERVGGGGWLPHLIGPADRQTVVRKAIDLAWSAGRILQRAAANGVVLAEIRPELMWAEWTDDRIAVTGLSARAGELFRRRRGDVVTHPLFDRTYRAPEADPDDRSVAFSLGAMIDVWLAGCTAPQPLQALLERARTPARAERPSLAELVAELDDQHR